MSRSAHLARRAIPQETPQETPLATQLRPARPEERVRSEAREPSFAAAELMFLRRLEELYAASFGSWEDFDPEAA
jgi:hypothetical protein